ncbi:MetQ/NlpA family ABC transporter substrate-binding protein [Psychrobacillus sp. NPDC096389]|uniref:MetQ/NlpA family ABC transporter substrate-binding protein n=1 Tax=Psychrobacillus sp. NPDC096389 TaxID=3364490 RepID=UPI00381820AA
MKKWSLAFVLIISLLLGACGNKDVDSVIKVGIRSSEIKTWEYIKEKAADKGIELELVNFSAQYDPNQALAEEEVDINAFQHLAYLNLFNENQKTDLQAIGSTIMAPIGLYSNQYKSLEEIPNGAQIAVPNDPSNWGRALMLLQEAGFLTVTDDFDGNGGADRIKDNPKNIEIVPVDGATTPRVMEDTAASIINNGVAVEAGLLLKDALIHESKTAIPFVNVIVAKPEDVENETLKEIVKIYQSEETANFITETYNGNYIPVILTSDEIKNWKEAYIAK